MKPALLLVSLFVYASTARAQNVEIESNNTFNTANPMVENIANEGAISDNDLTDYFVTSQAINGTLTVTFTAINTGTSTTYFEITGYDKRRDASRVFDKYVYLAPGTSLENYSFKVYGLALDSMYIQTLSNGGLFGYSFNYNVSDIPPKDAEPNDDYLTPVPLGFNQLKSGQVSYSSDLFVPDIGSPRYTRDKYDYYQIITPASGKTNVYLQVKSKENNTRHSVYLYDTKGKWITYLNQEDVVYINRKEILFDSTVTDTLSFNANANDTFNIEISAEEACIYSIGFNVAQQSYVTRANGNWNNPASWQGGVVPPPTAQVTLLHNITVTDNRTCYSLQLTGPGAHLTVLQGINFIITH